MQFKKRREVVEPIFKDFDFYLAVTFFFCFNGMYSQEIDRYIIHVVDRISDGHDFRNPFVIYERSQFACEKCMVISKRFPR